VLRKPWFWVVIVLLLVGFVVFFFRQSDPEEITEVPISQLLSDVSTGRVQRIEIRGDELEVKLTNLQTYSTTKEEGVSLYTLFADRGVDASNVIVEVKEPDALSGWLGLILNFLPVLLFLGLLIYLVRVIAQIKAK
jgi:ATP-dependent Zn protease